MKKKFDRMTGTNVSLFYSLIISLRQGWVSSSLPLITKHLLRNMSHRVAKTERKERGYFILPTAREYSLTVFVVKVM